MQKCKAIYSIIKYIVAKLHRNLLNTLLVNFAIKIFVAKFCAGPSLSARLEKSTSTVWEAQVSQHNNDNNGVPRQTSMRYDAVMIDGVQGGP